MTPPDRLNITLPLPKPGSVETVTLKAGHIYQLPFELSETTVQFSGQNLRMDVDGHGTLLLQNASEALSRNGSIIMLPDGTMIEGKDILLAMQPIDFSTDCSHAECTGGLLPDTPLFAEHGREHSPHVYFSGMKQESAVLALEDLLDTSGGMVSAGNSFFDAEFEPSPVKGEGSALSSFSDDGSRDVGTPLSEDFMISYLRNGSM